MSCRSSRNCWWSRKCSWTSDDFERSIYNRCGFPDWRRRNSLVLLWTVKATELTKETISILNAFISSPPAFTSCAYAVDHMSIIFQNAAMKLHIPAMTAIAYIRTVVSFQCMKTKRNAQNWAFPLILSHSLPTRLQTVDFQRRSWSWRDLFPAG